jgi:hypothetical protein
VYAFPGFVYLDVQKTGSNFVLEFLDRHARDQPVELRRHKPVDSRDPGTFYFITCREPLEQYLSLYSFGCMGHGGFRRRQGPDMYDGTASGFSAWLRHMLDGRARDTGTELRRYIKSGMEPYVGFQTFRFLYLSFASPLSVFASCRSAEDVREAFRTQRLWDRVIRNEELAGGLAELVRGELAPHIKDADAALGWLAAGERFNASERVDKSEWFTIDEGDLRLIQEREWFFFEALGYTRYCADLPPLALTALG